MGSGSWNRGVGVDKWGRESWGWDPGLRHQPPWTLTIFQTADTYFTSHVLRQIVFASNCPCVKSLASSLFVSNRPRQIVMYPDFRSCNNKLNLIKSTALISNLHLVFPHQYRSQRIRVFNNHQIKLFET